MAEENIREIRKDITSLIRSMPNKQDSFPTIGRLFKKLKSNPDFTKYRLPEREVLEISKLVSQYGDKGIYLLRIFEIALARYGVKHANVTERLRSKIDHFRNQQGELASFYRIRIFLKDFEPESIKSRNHGIEAPGVAEKRGKIALEGYTESKDYEFNE